MLDEECWDSEATLREMSEDAVTKFFKGGHVKLFMDWQLCRL